MIDLRLLCADLKNGQSGFRQQSALMISRIYSCLRHPSEKTKIIIDGWKEDFRYIYGEIATNLSSNSKLKKEKLLDGCGIEPVPGEDQTEALQMLFFSVQTYFSLLTKSIMENILQGLYGARGFSHEEIILGGFAEEYGIMNYCPADWYCWPVFELSNGLSDVMEHIRRTLAGDQYQVSAPDFQLNNQYDFIKQIYEAVIPKELRHALGEYYTPDWLAESTLESAIRAYGAEGPETGKLTIVDPTCGSGTFLLKAIALKRRNGSSLPDILETVRGIDINPLAVLTAKTNYLLSVLDLMDGAGAITLPVYIADVVNMDVHAEPEPDGGFLHSGNPAAVIRNRLAEDRRTVSGLGKSDLVIGNPPWINWEYMPEQYRQHTRQIWLDYNLLSAKGRDLSFSKEDISVLITYIAIDRLLAGGGVIGFVIRQGVFKSAQNGAGFRRFRIGGTGIQVIKVEDLSKIKAFESAANHTALFFARKGPENTYPVPYYLWEKRKDLKKYSFGAYAQLKEVMGQVSVSEQCAMPAVQEDTTSPWITADAKRMGSLKKVLGANDYRARTGVFTGGANAVYWLKIDGSNGESITVTNIVGRAKRKCGQLTAEIEKTFVFPMLKGGNVRKWKIRWDTYLLCPHTAETRIRPVPQEELARTAPRTMAYLRHFKEALDGRNGFAGWEKQIQRQAFHAVLRVGDYTFSKFKVVWKYIASEFVCAVIGSVDDRFLGSKLLLPNEKVMYVSTDNEAEAYYLCGILSSTIVSECVKSYMNPTSISAHVLNKLNIPAYDENNALHRGIAKLCKEGHGADDISEYIAGIDRLAAWLYADGK